MKKITTLLAMLMVVSSAFALTGTVSTGFESRYIFRGVILNEDVVTASVDLEHNKVYLSLDSYWATKDRDQFKNQLVLTSGLRVPEVLLTNLTLDVGVTFYGYTDNSYTNVNYTTEPFVGLAYAFPWVTATVYGHYDVDRDAFTGEAGLASRWNLLSFLALDLHAVVGAVDADDALGNLTDLSLRYEYLRTGASLVWNPTESVSVSTGVKYTFSENRVVDIDKFSWNAGLAYSF